MKIVIRIGVVVLSALPSLAIAHEGPRVWLSQSGEMIIPMTSDDDFDPQTYAPSSVYFSAFDEYINPGGPTPIETTQFPGFEIRRDGLSNIPDGTTIGFTLAGPLLKLNAAGTALNSTDAAPRLDIALGSTHRVTSTGVQDGFNFLYTGPGEHGHLTFTLLGDGSTAGAGADGVYALPIRVTSPTLAASNWIFLILQSNNTAAERQQAAVVAQGMATALPGDANFDGTVNFVDLLVLASHYGSTSGSWWATGDYDFDGAVNFADLLTLAANYGKSRSAASFEATAVRTVPEPSALGGGVAFACTLGRRGRPRAGSSVQRG
ncbi:MAG: hypothetical protein QM770_18450 [Tepidisphaeraceae bacterium]